MLIKPAGHYASITPTKNGSGYTGNPVVIALVLEGGDYLQNFDEQSLLNKLDWYRQQLSLAIADGNEALAQNNREALGLVAMAINGW